jgi:putative addiction module component (TIGR02574 family)
MLSEESRVRIGLMSHSVRDLYEKAAELPPNERAELAGLLLDSLEDERSPIAEQAWAAEIERRMAEYRAGRIKTLSWQEVRAHLHRADR